MYNILFFVINIMERVNFHVINYFSTMIFNGSISFSQSEEMISFKTNFPKCLLLIKIWPKFLILGIFNCRSIVD